MKIYISYFAQMRNFPSNIIGLSTAHWEPRYITYGRSQNGIIWMGIPPLKPGEECDGLCDGKCNPKHPDDCQFLKAYYNQLNKINFKELIQKIENIAQKVKEGEALDNVDVVLLVYEKYDNPCSERWPLKQWFKENGMELEEWHK